MKDLLEISCGLDIHKEKIVACILTGPLGKPTHSEIREFTTLIPDMLALRDWIISENCHYVAMESTGIYWRDSEWISTLLRAGLLNASFIPEKRIREFRDLNRYRKSIIRDITSQKNRIEKFLQSSGFRLSSFISDILGASGRNIILHLMEHGQIDKISLDSYLKTKTRKRIDEILMSVNGTLSEHQKSFLKILMCHYDSMKEHLVEIETHLQEDMLPFALQVEQLNTIYGISTTASCAIIAEIGTDMKPFKTAEHICSWADLCPGNNESAGKRKSTSITKGNPYIKSMLCEIAWVIAGKRNTYLSAWYWRIKQKKGARKAIVALARKLLVIIYTMLKQGTNFDENCFEVRCKNCEQKKLSHYRDYEEKSVNKILL